MYIILEKTVPLNIGDHIGNGILPLLYLYTSLTRIILSVCPKIMIHFLEGITEGVFINLYFFNEVYNDYDGILMFTSVTTM